MFRHVADALVTLVILIRYSYCSSRNAERKDSSDFSVPTVSVPCFHMVVTVRARTSFVVAGIRGGTWTSSNLTWQQLCHIASMRAGMVLSILQAWVRCLVASLLMIYIYTCICNRYAYLCYIYVSIIFIYTQLYMSYLFICLFIYVYILGIWHAVSGLAKLSCLVRAGLMQILFGSVLVRSSFADFLRLPAIVLAVGCSLCFCILPFLQPIFLDSCPHEEACKVSKCEAHCFHCLVGGGCFV